MLTLYLCPKRNVHYLPTEDRVQSWITSIQIGRLVASSIEEEQDTLSFAPGLGVIQLFNNEAREALLPAELTFESIQLTRVEGLSLLPPDQPDRTQSCPQCGDDIALEALERALRRRALHAQGQGRGQGQGERVDVFCQSCQDDIPLRRLIFEPESVFARFWITIIEAGSSRLNPALLRDWELKLGCGLTLLVDHRDSDLDEIDATRRRSELWSDFEGEHGDLGLAEELGLSSASGRDEYRRGRYLRRAQSPRRSRSKQRTHRARSGKGRARGSQLRWDDDD